MFGEQLDPGDKLVKEKKKIISILMIIENDAVNLCRNARGGVLLSGSCCWCQCSWKLDWLDSFAPGKVFEDKLVDFMLVKMKIYCRAALSRKYCRKRG